MEHKYEGQEYVRPIPVLNEHFGALDDDLVLVLAGLLALRHLCRARAGLATLTGVGHALRDLVEHALAAAWLERAEVNSRACCVGSERLKFLRGVHGFQ